MAQLDSSNPPSSPPQSRTAPSSFPESTAVLRREVEDLRKELKEQQRKSEREIQALNMEVRFALLPPFLPFCRGDEKADRESSRSQVTELESLVESKIYQEDELQTELEALRKAASSASSRPHVNGNGGKNGYAHSDADSLTDGGGECEMCGGAHELDACPDCLSSLFSFPRLSVLVLTGFPCVEQSPAPPHRPNRTLRRRLPTSARCRQLRERTEGRSSAMIAKVRLTLPFHSLLFSLDWRLRLTSGICGLRAEYGHSLDDCPLASEIF
jgi:hypothetical protein